MIEFNTGSTRSLGVPVRRRFFSVDEANHALPLVRRILTDVVAQYRLVERFRKRRRKLADQNRIDELKSADAQGIEAARRLADLMSELTSLGCEVKDYERGCVDFPFLRNGREACLCWRLNEEHVRHWHERYAGDTGRRSID
jgi:hypothetical protein